MTQTAQQRSPGFVYDQAPVMVYWELTRACELACIHCRAEAIERCDPNELTTAEGKRLLESVRAFGPRTPHVVLTGGDPLTRPDLFELIEYARSIGVPVALAPSATPRLTEAEMRKMLDLGINTMSLSLDGATAQRHDGIRGVPGTFDRTLDLIQIAGRLGIKIQINTLITDETHADLPAIYRLLEELKIMRWSLFFLITVGRGSALRPITSLQAEQLFHQVAEWMPIAPFEVKATEAPHFRRVAVQRMLDSGVEMKQIFGLPVGRGFGIRDGNGVVFVSHTGDVYPSGFLPLSGGNVRNSDLVSIYREAPLFASIRDMGQLKGKCGQCSYRTICGGSRARAYAMTGDPLESDPLCAYNPADGSISQL